MHTSYGPHAVAVPVFFVCLSLASAPGHAAVLHVSAAGNSGGDGSESNPYPTIQQAVNAMRGGDVVLIRAGNYTGPVRITSIPEVGPGAQAVVRGADGQAPVVRGGFDIDSSDVRLEKMVLTGSNPAGLVDIDASCSRVVVDGCTIDAEHTTGTFGVRFRQVGPRPADGPRECVVRDSLVRNCGQVCVDIFGDSNVVEHSTVSTSNGYDAFHVFGARHIIRNNELTGINNVSGNHPDVFQTFAAPGGTQFDSHDILVEGNYIHDNTGQLGNIEPYGNVAGIRDWTFRNNLVVNQGNTINIYARGFAFYNNTFYFAGQSSGHPLSFKTGKGNADNGVVKNNLFIGCGNTPDGSYLGWYSKAVGVVGLDADYNMVTTTPGDGFRAKSAFSEPHAVGAGNPRFAAAHLHGCYGDDNGGTYAGDGDTIGVNAREMSRISVDLRFERCTFHSGCDGVVRRVTALDPTHATFDFTPAIADYGAPDCTWNKAVYPDNDVCTFTLVFWAIGDVRPSDFRLADALSRAVDSGADLSSLGGAYDKNGVSRPKGRGWDLGAYEYQAGPSISIGSATVNEDGTATFTVTLTDPPAPAPGPAE